MMRSEKDTKYREALVAHLEYIKEKVDANHDHLEKINGRLRETEKSIAWMKGIGSTVVLIMSIVIGFFKINK
jgi:hypothetical protein